MKKLLATSFVLLAVSSAALASAPTADTASTEAYGHPSLFGKDAHSYVGTHADYITGGEITNKEDEKNIVNKDYVFVKSWARDVLVLIQETQEKAGHPVPFNPKAPTLRSEVATILAEGLDVETPESYEPYSDIEDDYWAKNWIYKVTEKGIMIGYPSGVFKPDQPITKAEVFATIARIIDIDYENVVPEYNNQVMEYVPTWAYNPTNEVVASNLLEFVPDQQGIVEAEYLTKEQTAFLVASLKDNLSDLQNNIAIKKHCEEVVELPEAQPEHEVRVKMLDRLSAKTSNVGDYFTAKTLSEVSVDGFTFPTGSIVRGKVIAVQRPGMNKNAFITVQFKRIKSGDVEMKFDERLSSVTADKFKNTCLAGRIIGAPFSMAARSVGVFVRSGSSVLNILANGFEQFGDELSDGFVETLSLHPGRGMASFGNSIYSIFKMGVNVVKIGMSGSFGIVYEVADEVVYIFAPSKSNAASINPDEELTIKF
ncbi:MAG: S-layer homology domain-containing protein [Candidatus Gastranaerophilales bacterium]